MHFLNHRTSFLKQIPQLCKWVFKETGNRLVLSRKLEVKGLPSFTFTISNLSFIAGDLMYSYKYNNLTQSVPSYCLFSVNVERLNNNRWFSFNIWLSVNSKTKMLTFHFVNHKLCRIIEMINAPNVKNV